MLTLHHIISDGWSSGIFWRELNALYQALEAGEPSPLAPLGIQYADYAVWQRGWLQGAVLEQQERYWREQLEGLVALELPTDHPRPPIQTSRGAVYERWLPLSFQQGVQQLCQQEQVTQFMLLLAAFQV